MILGIDLGKKTTGLAISHGQISTPFKTISHKSQKEAVEKISDIIKSENVDKVILGFVEGQIKKLFDDFEVKLKEKNPNLEIIMWDETLTTRQAQELAIKLHIRKTKKK